MGYFGSWLPTTVGVVAQNVAVAKTAREVNQAEAYSNRGLLKDEKLNDPQGNTQFLQAILGILNQLGATE